MPNNPADETVYTNGTDNYKNWYTAFRGIYTVFDALNLPSQIGIAVLCFTLGHAKALHNKSPSIGDEDLVNMRLGAAAALGREIDPSPTPYPADFNLSRKQ